MDAGVDPFFTRPLVFLPPSVAATEILTCIGGRLNVDQAALAWHRKPDFVLQVVNWMRPDVVDEFEIPVSAPTLSSDQFCQLFPLSVPRLHWMECSSTATGSRSDFSLQLGLPDAESLKRLPENWRKLISGIFSWTLLFEDTLRDRKLSALAEFAAGAGHEINNPLGSIVGRTAQLLKAETDPEKRRQLETIGAQAYRIGDMIGDTMLFANPPAGCPIQLSLSEEIPLVLAKFSLEIEQSGIVLDCSDCEPGSVFIDPDQFRIVIAELLKNAIWTMQSVPLEKAPRQLTVRWGPVESHGQPGGMLEVTDTGPGLTPDQQEHCFDPFYSGRPAGRGLGFGLSKCWRIIQQHQGTISLNRGQERTRVTVWLPGK